ncbi:MAG: type II toxin-antitoxin system RelE/ParE family toxin [Mucilaginibacter sp.]|jgi:plasmid stabilization system protein ParE|uniref:type II toxin-antitoxin system RelE/ParE family toxin n=1 Tax=Mucilaginibacter sp. TaxID=1882438 RepID=UPI00356B46CD
MPTGLKVVLSKKADKDFDDIINYIKKDFGSQPAVNFKALILNFLDLLQAFPEIGSLELSNKNLRAFVAHKRLKIFYRVDSNRIIILRLFDTRQHPDKQ